MWVRRVLKLTNDKRMWCCILINLDLLFQKVSQPNLLLTKRFLHFKNMMFKSVLAFSEGTFHLRSPSSGSGLNDGQWHAIRLVAKENFAMLTIDGEEASAVRSTSPLTITTGGTYHLGGKGRTQHHHHRFDKHTLSNLHSSSSHDIPLQWPSGREGAHQSLRWPRRLQR